MEQHLASEKGTKKKASSSGAPAGDWGTQSTGAAEQLSSNSASESSSVHISGGGGEHVVHGGAVGGVQARLDGDRDQGSTTAKETSIRQ